MASFFKQLRQLEDTLSAPDFLSDPSAAIDFSLDPILPAKPRYTPEPLTVADFATAAEAHETCYFYHRRYGFGPYAPWKVDDARVADACAFLGITWPMEARIGTRRELGVGCIAAYMADRDHDRHSGFRPCLEKEHLVIVRPPDGTTGPILASTSLWHELAHARQAERYAHPKAFFDAINDDGRYEKVRKIMDAGFADGEMVSAARSMYLENQFEQEAFSCNRFHFDHFPLTVPA